MHKISKYQTLLAGTLTALFVVALAFGSLAHGQGAGILGWLWGGSTDESLGAASIETATGLGWISASSDNPETAAGEPTYALSIPTTDGNVSGFAWSSNVGWVDFDPAGPYPTAPNQSATRVGSNLIGWARIVSIQTALADTATLGSQPQCLQGGNSGCWEGWVKLAGANYGVTIQSDGTVTCPNCYAWSNELGWIDFSGLNAPQLCGNGTVDAGEQCDDGGTVSGDGCSATCQLESMPPTCTIALNPTIPAGAEAPFNTNIEWSSTNTDDDDCVASSIYHQTAWDGTKAASGSQNIDIQSNDIFTLNCTNASGTGSCLVDAILTQPPLTCSGGPDLYPPTTNVIEQVMTPSGVDITWTMLDTGVSYDSITWVLTHGGGTKSGNSVDHHYNPTDVGTIPANGVAVQATVTATSGAESTDATCEVIIYEKESDFSEGQP